LTCFLYIYSFKQIQK